jgi:hypothetical protein
MLLGLVVCAAVTTQLPSPMGVTVAAFAPLALTVHTPALCVLNTIGKPVFVSWLLAEILTGAPPSVMLAGGAKVSTARVIAKLRVTVAGANVVLPALLAAMVQVPGCTKLSWYEIAAPGTIVTVHTLGVLEV